MDKTFDPTDKTMRTLMYAATPSPWEEYKQTGSVSGADGDEIIETNHEDAQFVVAARHWVPTTLNRLDEVRALHAPIDGVCPACDMTSPCDTLNVLNTNQTN